MAEELIPRQGGYRKLKTFRIARLVYDLTVRFCDRYIDRRSRTHDQMVQAARSGVQNIAEGSQMSGTSRKMEMKLTNVARASLEELRLDYEDFLRQRGLERWRRNDERRRILIDRRPESVEEVVQWVMEVREDGRCGPSGSDGHSPPAPLSPRATYAEIAANGVLTLLDVVVVLLDRQLAAQARAFEEEGGFTERLHRRRTERRRQPR
jgi:four helix bundle suffix protein